MKTKQKLFLTLLVLIGCLPMSAQETTKVQKLVISMDDNAEVSFLMSEEPIIKFHSAQSFDLFSGSGMIFDVMTVTTNGGRWNYRLIN